VHAEAVGDTTQQVEINGELRSVPTGLTLEGLVAHLRVDVRHVAVEHNRTLIVKARLAEVQVQPGDCIEIVTFVGGG